MFNHVMLMVDFGGGEVVAVPATQLDITGNDKLPKPKPWTRGKHPDTTSWKNYRKTQYR